MSGTVLWHSVRILVCACSMSRAALALDSTVLLTKSCQNCLCLAVPSAIKGVCPCGGFISLLTTNLRKTTCLLIGALDIADAPHSPAAEPIGTAEPPVP